MFFKTINQKISNLEKAISSLRENIWKTINANEGSINKLHKKLEDFERIKVENDVKIRFIETVIDRMSEDYKKLYQDVAGANAKKELEQRELELKWEYEKLKKGNEVAKRGAEIINKRQEVYDNMLTAQRKENSVLYEKYKEQLKSFDWILERINEKN